MTVEPLRAKHLETRTIELGAGILEVLSLDDPLVTYCDRPVEWAYKSRSRQRILVTATCAQFEELQADLEYRGWGSGWDQPFWYPKSARAAYHKIAEGLR